MKPSIESVVPRVVFSRCLGFEACRYNGHIIREPVVEHLKPFVEAVTVCPEVEIGLGIPRQPIRLVGTETDRRLVQPETGLDVTEAMQRYVDRILDDLADEPPDGFVLKYGSPSCGPREVKVYASDKRGSAFVKSAGAFGGPVAARFPRCAIEDEGRLKSFDIRQHYLTRLFTLARFRVALDRGRMRDIVAFHAAHKLLLMAYHQTQMRALGRIVANVDKRTSHDVFEAYAEGLDAALARAPRRTSAINVLMHAFGYVSDSLTRGEKAFFLDALEQYRDRRVPLSVPTGILRSWIIRFDVDYLANQVAFEPFPAELVEVLDSGKGRPL